jgi:hypothetical protein
MALDVQITRCVAGEVQEVLNVKGILVRASDLTYAAAIDEGHGRT